MTPSSAPKTRQREAAGQAGIPLGCGSLFMVNGEARKGDSKHWRKERGGEMRKGMRSNGKEKGDGWHLAMPYMGVDGSLVNNPFTPFPTDQKLFGSFFMSLDPFLTLQAITKLHEAYSIGFSAAQLSILLDVLSSISSHANEVTAEVDFQQKLQRACSHLEISEPPLVHFENETCQSYLKLLEAILTSHPSLSVELGVEPQIVATCEKILHIYLSCADEQPVQQSPRIGPTLHWMLPLGLTKKEELAARTSLVVSALRVLSRLERDSFRRYLPSFFPFLVNLVRSEHSSGERFNMLSKMPYLEAITQQD
ncbi:hypothetical protein Taro_043426 [Colocasia esculenta]|uniref:Sec7/BIG1-like C-terminal domain-containing protein n=1 Tax=Colocasia esculenta TaxID=4460 RepID=A0A843WJF0_COLES|nr:hypothetical protein [Colocasia esculenta]